MVKFFQPLYCVLFALESFVIAPRIIGAIGFSQNIDFFILFHILFVLVYANIGIIVYIHNTPMKIFQTFFSLNSCSCNAFTFFREYITGFYSLGCTAHLYLQKKATLSDCSVFTLREMSRLDPHKRRFYIGKIPLFCSVFDGARDVWRHATFRWTVA